MLDFGCNDYTYVKDVFAFEALIPGLSIYMIYLFWQHLHSYHSVYYIIISVYGEYFYLWDGIGQSTVDVCQVIVV